MSSIKQRYEPLSTTNGLDESFIATATPIGSPYETEARPYLQVVAPATLPEGYTFQAQLNGQPFTVTVPMGGVEEGQKFSIEVPPNLVGMDVLYSGGQGRSSVPVGHWRDDLCACCGLGCFHPTLCMAYCCPMILLGQVMHRLQLTWTANEGDNNSAYQTSSTFRILFWMGIVWIGMRILLNFLPMMMMDGQGELSEGAASIIFILNLLVGAIFIFFLVLLCKTRRHIREKYQIPEQQCHGCEDCCCTYWCSCCTVAQMARHTGDYKEHGARLCSETGLGPGAPSIV